MRMEATNDITSLLAQFAGGGPAPVGDPRAHSRDMLARLLAEPAAATGGRKAGGSFDPRVAGGSDQMMTGAFTVRLQRSLSGVTLGDLHAAGMAPPGKTRER